MKKEPQSADHPRALVVTELVIVDKEGRPRIRLGMADGPSVSLLDRDGQKRLSISIDEVSVGPPAPSLFMTGPGPDYEPVVGLGQGDQGAYMDLNHFDGEHRIRLAVEDGLPVLHFGMEVPR